MREPALSVVKYRFERVFAAPEAANDRPDLGGRLAILQAEFDLLRDERDRAVERARAEGYEAGLRDARGDREAAMLAAIDSLQSTLEEVDDRLEAAVKSATAGAGELALAAADIIAARALDLLPGQAIDDAIGRVLKQVARGTHLAVRVHPDIRPEIERLVEERIAADRRKLSIQVFSDASLAPHDALIAWDEGGLSLDEAARRAALAEELEPLLRG